MRPTFNAATMKALSRQLAVAGRQVDKRFLSSAFKDALKPLEEIARREAPVGQKSTINPHRVRLKKGKITRDQGFDRGGATRRDIRTKIVDGVDDEYIRGLVGVNKNSGHVGWRTIFITKGTRSRKTKKGYNRGSTRANNFLERAENRGVPLVIARLTPAAQAIVQNIVNKLR